MGKRRMQSNTRSARTEDDHTRTTDCACMTKQQPACNKS